jgi:hypothetical protein
MMAVTVCVGSGLAHLGTSTLPFQIGAVMDAGHRNASGAGVFGLAESAALALGMILVSPRVDRIAPRTIALVGCLLSVLANAGLFLTVELHLQTAFAALAGIGYGWVFAATVAGVAATSEPDRLYAIGNAGALVLIVGVMVLLPLAGSVLGALGIFAAFALFSLLCAPLFLTLKSGKRTERSSLAAWRIPGARGLLFAWVAYSGGTGATYAFAERIGTSIQLSPAQIAGVLSAGMFVGLIGTAAAAVLGRRANRPWALVIGMLGSGSSCVALGYATSLATFAAAIFAYWVFCMFLYSYWLGTAALLDPAGRIGTLGGGLEKLGVGGGVFIAGALAEHTTYSATGMLGFASCLLGFALGFPSLFRAIKRHSLSAMQASAGLIA